jgi:hypothetical protein
MDDGGKRRFNLIQMSDANNERDVFKLTDKTVFSDLPESEKVRITSELEKAKTDFKRQTEEAERDFPKFLFVVNSGGAIAFLAFLHESAHEIQNSAAIWPLLMFGIGIILLGVALMINSFGSTRKTTRYINDAAAFLRDEIPLLKLRSKVMSGRKVGVCIINTLCIFSFLAFIFGCVSAYNVLHPDESNSPAQNQTVIQQSDSSK